MNSVELTADQRQLIEQIAHDNGFRNYQLEAILGSNKGDNYMGLITSVTIEESGKKLKLILKAAPLGVIRKQMSTRKAFLREIFMYEKVFPKFEELQKEFGIADPFRSHAKLYGSYDGEFNECLVLEDLRGTGFGMWNRKMLMDHDHIAAVIKEYARLHAVSLAMREKKPADYEELTKDLKGSIWEVEREKVEMHVGLVMSKIWNIFEDDPVATGALKVLEKRIPAFFCDMAEHPDDIVIAHEDCWCNNLMFGYKNQDKPTAPSAIRIIDWQLSKLGSPAWDLAYFFLVHSPKHILYDYERYLKLYYEILSKNLREFHCDPKEIFPYRVLLENWNERVSIGVYMAFTILKILLCDCEEAPDFSEITEGGKDLVDILNFAPKDSDTFSTRIRDLVQFSIDEGFL